MLALLEKLLIQLPEKKKYIYGSEGRVRQAIWEDEALGHLVYLCYGLAT